MKTHPLRLLPGSDLSEALEAFVAEARVDGFVVCGIGSLVDARLRFADRDAATVIEGPSEIVSLSGSLSADGAHLHMSISTAEGVVYGGHAVRGNKVRTTAEVLLVLLPEWRLVREPDPATGYDELVVRPRRP